MTKEDIIKKIRDYYSTIEELRRDCLVFIEESLKKLPNHTLNLMDKETVLYLEDFTGELEDVTSICLDEGNIKVNFLNTSVLLCKLTFNDIIECADYIAYEIPSLP